MYIIGWDWLNTLKAVAPGAYLILEAQKGGLLEWVLFKEGLEKKFFTLKHIKVEIQNINMEYIN